MKSTYSQNSLRNPHALYMLSQLDYTSFMNVIQRFDRAHNKEISIDVWGFQEQEKIDKIKLKNIEADLAEMKKLKNKDLVELCAILKYGTRATINLYKLRNGLTVQDYDHYNFYHEETTKKYLSDFLSILVLLDLDQPDENHPIYKKYFDSDGNEYMDFLPNKKKSFIDMILNEGV